VDYLAFSGCGDRLVVLLSQVAILQLKHLVVARTIAELDLLG
jgi:hypothetical protein